MHSVQPNNQQQMNWRGIRIPQRLHQHHTDWPSVDILSEMNFCPHQVKGSAGRHTHHPARTTLNVDCILYTASCMHIVRQISQQQMDFRSILFEIAKRLHQHHRHWPSVDILSENELLSASSQRQCLLAHSSYGHRAMATGDPLYIVNAGCISRPPVRQQISRTIIDKASIPSHLVMQHAHINIIEIGRQLTNCQKSMFCPHQVSK